MVEAQLNDYLIIKRYSMTNYNYIDPYDWYTCLYNSVILISPLLNYLIIINSGVNCSKFLFSFCKERENINKFNLTRKEKKIPWPNKMRSQF